MRKILLASLFLETFLFCAAQCQPPRIIEFGAVDEPCMITITADCDSCACVRMCDGDTVPRSQVSWPMPPSGTHRYRAWISNGCGSDSADATIQSRGCGNFETGISEISQEDTITSRCILAMDGRIVSGSDLPPGIYEEIFFTRNSYSVKRFVIFK